MDSHLNCRRAILNLEAPIGRVAAQIQSSHLVKRKRLVTNASDIEAKVRETMNPGPAIFILKEEPLA